MKNASARKKEQTSADKEMRDEYRFDYTKSKPNRFAKKMEAGTIAIVLDPDVAAVFRNAKSVNTMLRSVIAATKSK